jgi:hypothetical protein
MFLWTHPKVQPISSKFQNMPFDTTKKCVITLNILSLLNAKQNEWNQIKQDQTIIGALSAPCKLPLTLPDRWDAMFCQIARWKKKMTLTVESEGSTPPWIIVSRTSCVFCGSIFLKNNFNIYLERSTIIPKRTKWRKGRNAWKFDLENTNKAPSFG